MIPSARAFNARSHNVRKRHALAHLALDTRAGIGLWRKLMCERFVSNSRTTPAIHRRLFTRARSRLPAIESRRAVAIARGALS